MINNEELKQISSLKERAETERLRAQAKLNAFAGYEHRNSVYNQPVNEKRKLQADVRKHQALRAFRDVLKKPALQLTTQEQKKYLEHFAKYLQSNKVQRDQYVAEAKAEFERASQEIETQIEHRKKIFAEQITPRILSIFLPKGPESIKIYSAIDQKEFFFLRIAQENIMI